MPFEYTYIFNVFAYDKAVILVAIHFSMQNIELWRDIGPALGQGFESIRQ